MFPIYEIIMRDLKTYLQRLMRKFNTTSQHGSAILQNNPLSYPNNIVEIKFNPEMHDIVSASLKRLHLF